MINIPFIKRRSAGEKQEAEVAKVVGTTEALYQRGVTTLKDLVAPAALEITPQSIKIGERLARTFFVFNYPRYLTSNWFSGVINLDQSMDIAMYLHPVDTATVLKQLRKKVAEIESQIALREEKGLVRDPILETAYQDTEELRDKLQQAHEKLFQFSLYITMWAETNEELNSQETLLRSILEAKLVYLKTTSFQQEVGLRSVLPFNEDRLRISTNLDTDSLSTIFPFISFDLTTDRGIMYGINRHNNSLIIFDRFTLPNANMVVFGQSGGGKSYAMKLEILRSLMYGIDVIIIDPENEYQYLVEVVGGSVFRISLTSPHHINPFDLPPEAEGESKGDLLRAHMLEIVGLLKVMLKEVTPEEDALLDKAVTEAYASRNITPDADFRSATPPTLNDLVTIMTNLAGGDVLAQRLQKYTEGSYSGFINNPSNIDLQNRTVLFSIRDLEDELRPVAMYLILHYVWNIVRSSLKKRLLVIDEAWWMMQYEEGGAFLLSMAKRARKYYLGLTTITQDVNDFMASKFGQPIITNSSLQLLLKQSPATSDVVTKTFNLTEEEKYLLLEANIGEGLFFAGLKHVAIKIVASYTEDQIITSDPEQLLAIRKARADLAKT